MKEIDRLFWSIGVLVTINATGFIAAYLITNLI